MKNVTTERQYSNDKTKAVNRRPEVSYIPSPRSIDCFYFITAIKNI